MPNLMEKDQEILQLKDQVAQLASQVFGLQIANNTLIKAMKDLARLNIRLCDRLEAYNIPLDDNPLTPSDEKMLKDMGIKNE